MSEIQRLESIPTNMRMNYGPVLKKDNPLISSWVQAVNELPKDKAAKAPDRMQVLASIISLLNTLVAKFFDKEEDDDVTQEDDDPNQPATKA